MYAILVNPIPLDEVLEEQGAGQSCSERKCVCGNNLKEGERERRLCLFSLE